MGQGNAGQKDSASQTQHQSSQTQDPDPGNPGQSSTPPPPPPPSSSQNDGLRDGDAKPVPYSGTDTSQLNTSTDKAPWSAPNDNLGGLAGGGAGNGKTAVNVDMIKKFGDNVRLMRDSLNTSYDELGTVNVKAGGFKGAYDLAQGINGGGKDSAGLAPDIQSAIYKLMQALTDLGDKLHGIGNDYHKAEDLNNMKSKDFSKYLDKVGTDIGGITGKADPAKS
jgi:hypothetical protein